MLFASGIRFDVLVVLLACGNRGYLFLPGGKGGTNIAPWFNEVDAKLN